MSNNIYSKKIEVEIMNKFNREVFHNRDIKYKICLINHVQYIFDLEGIKEKVVHIIPTEYIDKDFSNKRLDFAVECESGNIYDIECETNSVSNTTADKTWNYAKNLHCKYDNKIYSLIIALAEKKYDSDKENWYNNTQAPIIGNEKI